MFHAFKQYKKVIRISEKVVQHLCGNLGKKFDILGVNALKLLKLKIFYSLLWSLLQLYFPSSNQRQTIQKKNYKDSLLKETIKILNKIIFWPESKKSLSGAPVLIVVPGTHAIKLTTLYKALEKEKIKSNLLIYNSTLKQRFFLLKNKINYFSKNSLLDKKTLKNSQKFTKKFQEKWQEPTKKIKFAPLNLSLEEKDVVKTTIVSFLDSALKNDYQLFQDVFLAKKIIQKARPKILVTTTDPDISALQFVERAKKTRLKTLCLQHGAFVNFMGVDFESDFMTVWGRYSKEWFIRKLKKKPKQLFITGSVFFDHFCEKKQKLTRKNLKKAKKINILFLLTNYSRFGFSTDYFDPFKNWQQGTLKKIFQLLIKLNKKISVEIRYHPFQKIPQLEKIIAKQEILVKLESRQPLYNQLLWADIVITQDTTAGFEALILKKPLIHLTPLFAQDHLPFSEYQTALKVSDGEETVKAIEKLINNPFLVKKMQKNAKKLLADYFYKLDGQSGKRTADLIKRLLDRLQKSHW